jgi:hypothetical protein
MLELVAEGIRAAAVASAPAESVTVGAYNPDAAQGIQRMKTFKLGF